jgi:hypothetical protein
MRPVYIECVDVASIGCTTSRAVALNLNMTRHQEREAVMDILMLWPEQEAFDWLRSEFPAWFKETA